MNKSEKGTKKAIAILAKEIANPTKDCAHILTIFDENGKKVMRFFKLNIEKEREKNSDDNTSIGFDVRENYDFSKYTKKSSQNESVSSSDDIMEVFVEGCDSKMKIKREAKDGKWYLKSIENEADSSSGQYSAPAMMTRRKDMGLGISESANVKSKKKEKIDECGCSGNGNKNEGKQTTKTLMLTIPIATQKRTEPNRRTQINSDVKNMRDIAIKRGREIFYEAVSSIDADDIIKRINEMDGKTLAGKYGEPKKSSDGKSDYVQAIKNDNEGSENKKSTSIPKEAMPKYDYKMEKIDGKTPTEDEAQKNDWNTDAYNKIGLHSINYDATNDDFEERRKEQMGKRLFDMGKEQKKQQIDFKVKRKLQHTRGVPNVSTKSDLK